jgi:hypothetical protein
MPALQLILYKMFPQGQLSSVKCAKWFKLKMKKLLDSPQMESPAKAGLCL